MQITERRTEFTEIVYDTRPPGSVSRQTRPLTVANLTEIAKDLKVRRVPEDAQMVNTGYGRYTVRFSN